MSLLSDVIGSIATKVAPVRWKEFKELRYWKRRKQAEGVMSNDHYERFYTAHFGLDASWYAGKVILDIGCGPRGSLEWASTARRRIGLDPLANEYLRLGADRHRMEYMAAPSEKIPLPDGACDAVFSFNSLDHVEDVERTLQEIKRVTRSGGLFLLLVEINHAPTDCEPHFLTPKRLVDGLKPEFECRDLQAYALVPGGVYDAIDAGKTLADPAATTQPAYLSAKFARSGAST